MHTWAVDGKMTTNEIVAWKDNAKILRIKTKQNKISENLLRLSGNGSEDFLCATFSFIGFHFAVDHSHCDLIDCTVRSVCMNKQPKFISMYGHTKFTFCLWDQIQCHSFLSFFVCVMCIRIAVIFFILYSFVCLSVCGMLCRTTKFYDCIVIHMNVYIKQTMKM